MGILAAVTRVLIVEHDVLLASRLAGAFRARDLLVAIAASFAEATALIDCDIVLCDLGVPDGDGLGFLRWVREQRPDLGVIALAESEQASDVVTALTNGAVDYITKPLRLNDVLARVDAHLRIRSALTNASSNIIDAGDLHIDLGARDVRVGRVAVELRLREFEVIVQLARRAGKVATRESLMREVWGEAHKGSTKTLDVHINSIRRKLGERPGRPSRITAIRNVGYRLELRTFDTDA